VETGAEALMIKAAAEAGHESESDNGICSACNGTCQKQGLFFITKGYVCYQCGYWQNFRLPV
jgi:hypothetical protein